MLYLDRRALADTAPATGLLFRVILAVALGAFGLPELVSAQTQSKLEVANMSAEEVYAAVAGSIGGGLIGGGVPLRVGRAAVPIIH